MRAERALDFLARQIVDHPDEVEVTPVDKDRGVTLELRCHPDDLGKVIGRRGRTARALRQVLSAAGALDDRNVHVEIID